MTDFDKRVERLKKVGFSWFDSEIRQDRETLEWAANELVRLKPLEANGIDLANIVQEQDAELVRLRDVLSDIADQGTSQPAALNMPEEDWYRRLLWQTMSKARAALNNRSDEDGHKI